MVHLVDCLGRKPLGVILQGFAQIGQLPLGVIVLDPRDDDHLVEIIRPALGRGFCDFCDYLRDHVPGGDLLCQESDLCGARKAFDQGWFEGDMYRCHMDLCEFAVVLEVADDKSDPLIWGQARLPDAEITKKIEDLPERLKCLADTIAKRRADAEEQLRNAQHGGARRRWEHRLKELKEQEKKAREDIVVLADPGELEKHVRELRDRIETPKPITPDEVKPICRRLAEGGKIIRELALTRQDLGRTLHRMKSGLSQAWGAAEELGTLEEPWVGEASQTENAEMVGVLAGDILQGLLEARQEIEGYERLRKGEAERELVEEWHPLRRMIEQAMSHHQDAAHQRNIEIRMYGTQPPDPYALVDWDLMMEVLDILLDNAVKYSMSGTPSNPRTIKIWWEQAKAGQDLCVWVEDYGLQIEPGDRERIFEPGVRGTIRDPRRQIPGSGRGLAIAKRTIPQHGGTVDVWCKLFDDPDDRPPPPKVPMGLVRFWLCLPGYRTAEKKPEEG